MRSLPIVVLLAVCAVVGCGERYPAESIHVTVAQFGDFFLYAPLYVAIDAGFMKDQGLSVDVINTGGDENTWAAVLSGRAQFGVADPTFIAIAGQRGRPGRAVAAMVNSVPFWGISFTVHPDTVSPTSLADALSGRVVATFPSPSTAYTLQEQLNQDLGITARIREVAPGNLMATLRAGEADVALELEPAVSQAVSQGAHVLYSLADRYPSFIITGVTVTPDYLAQHQQTVDAFVCALQKAFTFIRQRPDSTLDILVRRFPIDRSVAANALARVVHAMVIPETAVIPESDWLNAIALRRAAGDLAESAPWQEYVSNGSAEKAAADCR